eukprot:645048-Amphidinium_carterae.2
MCTQIYDLDCMPLFSSPDRGVKKQDQRPWASDTPHIRQHGDEQVKVCHTMKIVILRQKYDRMRLFTDNLQHVFFLVYSEFVWSGVRCDSSHVKAWRAEQ